MASPIAHAGETASLVRPPLGSALIHFFMALIPSFAEIEPLLDLTCLKYLHFKPGRACVFGLCCLGFLQLF